MPEFERKKHKSLTEKQLYDEYYEIDKKKKTSSKSKKGGNPTSKNGKKRTSKPVKREDPPISAERQRIKALFPEENAVRTDRASDLFGKKKKHPSPQKRSAPPKGGTTKKAVNAKKRSSSQQKTGTAKKGAGSVSRAKTRKKKHGSYILYYFLCGIVAAAVVSILSVTVLFNISRFEIIGDTEYTDEIIIAAAGIEEGENLLRIDMSAAEKRITSELVYIDRAKLSRGFPDKLVITVDPAVPLASFYISGRYYLISEGGRVLDISNNRGSYPIITGYVLDPVKEMKADTKTAVGKQLEEDGDKKIAAALSIIGYMKSSGLTGEYSIDLTDILSIKVIYDERIELELGTTAAMDEKIFNASLLILDQSKIAENERCVIIATNPNRMSKRLIRDGEVIDNGYVVTTTPETEPVAESEPPPEGEPQ